jgi:hypothetical protein
MRLVASLSSLRPKFAPGSVHVRFMTDKVALGQCFPCQYHSAVTLNADYHVDVNNRPIGDRSSET